MPVFYLILFFTTIVSFFGYYIKSKRGIVGDFSIPDYESQRYYKSVPLFFAFATFFVMLYFICYRSNYGDTWLYVSSFENATSNLSYIKKIIDSDSDCKGYDILLVLFKHYISDDYSVWFTFLALFSSGAFIKLYYQHSINFAMSSFLFITSGTFTWLMNGVRQFFAVCIIIYGFNYIIERKFFRFFILVLLATTIHSTAIIWIPVYFIVVLKPWSKWIWLCIAITILIILGIDQFTTFLDDSLEGTAFEGVGTAINSYTFEDGSVDDGVNPIRVLIAAVPAIIAFWRRKYVVEYDDIVINICVNLSVVATGVYLLGMATSGIMIGRLPIYFTLTNYVLLPWLLDKVFEGKFKVFMKVMCYLCYFIYFYYAYKIQSAGYYGSEKLGLFC